MCKFKPKNKGARIDECMRTLIQKLDAYLKDDIQIVACCCGHRKYPMSLLVKQSYASGEEFVWDMCSDTLIPRTKKFYKKDKEGYYYIPEVLKNG